jgi:hypothetical protein
MGILARIRAALTTPSPVRPDELPERCVLDNRAFLLGLDGLYREAINPHERGELLACARRTAHRLGLLPADVPIEGYYAEDEALTEYFRLMRALQDTPASRAAEVAGLSEYQRLREVASSPLYGRARETGTLLPTGRDPLSQALAETWPRWTIANLTAAATTAALDYDDISLVGLAARIRDPVVLTALRESVVLYGELVAGESPRPVEFVWEVDPELAALAARFIEAFRALFGDQLPPPVAENASLYWYACGYIRGRCVQLGTDQTLTRHYHWAICPGPDGIQMVREFWNSEIWTTSRYRDALRMAGGCPDL